ncbi:hypothetical protein [Halomonas sp. PR-M31]|uniref:hypothetical protein n=1 Tax=Halomonas sp. PR-M31 TaxID=1471202 RepID=UPI001C10431A|nr:hypothetical protein [Halomonas sp. PR-M31]
MKNDLMPICLQRNWLPVYVDLWANQLIDTGQLIESAIVQALQAQESQIKKLLRTAGIDQIGLLQTIEVSWSSNSGKLPEGSTLTEALQLLYAAAGRMIVLIVDEAQHALDTSAGINSMYALKAARDAMTLGTDTPRLRLIFTGSSRDKLAQLVLNRKQPFLAPKSPPFHYSAWILSRPLPLMSTTV